MKLFPNLAGGLRFYFGVARALTLVFTAFWILTFTIGPALQKRFLFNDPKLMVSVGEVSLDESANPIALTSNTAKPGSVAMVGLRGSFQADLLSNDPALATALRWTIFPTILVTAAFSWFLLTWLRNLCANIGRGEPFSDGNLRLVRKIGLTIIAYSLARVLVQLFAAHVMNAYLMAHVITSGLSNAAGLRLTFVGSMITGEAGLVIGFITLLMAQAFRQGLAFKAENDLTV